MTEEPFRRFGAVDAVAAILTRKRSARRWCFLALGERDEEEEREEEANRNLKLRQ